jgi:hypothetical protein
MEAAEQRSQHTSTYIDGLVLQQQQTIQQEVSSALMSASRSLVATRSFPGQAAHGCLIQAGLED